MNKINEECGVFGMFCPNTENVAASTYYGLFALQHRGQQSCGIVVNDKGVFRSFKDAGTVNDMITPQVLDYLGCGNMALGHVRYGIAKNDNREHAQPAIIDHIKGHMAVAHNGSLTNFRKLRRELEMSGSIFHNASSAELISYVIIRERFGSESIEEAVTKALTKLEGAYSMVVMAPNKLIAAKDPHGFRPLCYGITPDGSYVVASETCALDTVNAKLVREIEPGEVIVIDKDGLRSITTHCGECEPSLCVFEYVYFARPDSVIDGISVHEARLRAGAFLAQEHPVEADVVIGVPDSGIDAAIGYSRESGIPYGLGFIKNKYIGRTFIAPGQSCREDKVKIKLNAVPSTIKDKRVVMVDDSIVRGTTSKKIVALLRSAGAKEVHIRLASPPFINACWYGTDIDREETLIARTHTLEQIAKAIDVDSIGYLSIDSAKKLAVCGKNYCLACFTGEYPTPNSDKEAEE